MTVKETMRLWATTPVRSPQQKGIVTGMVCDKALACLEQQEKMPSVVKQSLVDEYKP